MRRQAVSRAFVVSASLASGLVVRELDESNRSYLAHKPCWEAASNGIGFNIDMLRPFVDLAQRLRLRYVCNPEEWVTGGHHTGNLGWLFGCVNKSVAQGDLASLQSVKHMHHSDALWKAAYEHLYPPIEERHIYDVAGCAYWQNWGLSYKWFRSQYHLVRSQDPTRQVQQCWDTDKIAASGKKVIAVAIRRGDYQYHSSMPVTVFTKVLSLLFAHEPAIVQKTGLDLSEENAHIVIVSETMSDNPEMQLFERQFKKASVGYFLGSMETKTDTAVSRFVRDLDCLTQADVFISSSPNAGGAFNELAGALLQNGTAIFLGKNWEKGADFPHSKGMLTGKEFFLQLASCGPGGSRGGECALGIEDHELPHAFRFVV